VRIEVERLRLKTLSTLQGQYCDQADKQTALSTEEEASRLDRFKTASDYLANSGYFKTSLQTLGTAVVTIVPPLVAVVVAVLKYYKEP
jgi:hypothetical protein